MSTRRAGRLATVTATLFTLAVVGSTASAAGAQDDGEARVRDLEFRVRDLEYNWRAQDNSERVEQSAEETTIAFAADVLFAYDQADLTPEAQQRLDEVVGQLDELGPRAITVVGHTDDHGEPTYNQDLSQRRADAVRAHLESALGGDYTFEVSGRGEDEPVAPNQHENGADNPEGRALNRRVEITFPTT